MRWSGIAGVVFFLAVIIFVVQVPSSAVSSYSGLLFSLPVIGEFVEFVGTMEGFFVLMFLPAMLIIVSQMKDIWREVQPETSFSLDTALVAVTTSMVIIVPVGVIAWMSMVRGRSLAGLYTTLGGGIMFLLLSVLIWMELEKRSQG